MTRTRQELESHLYKLYGQLRSASGDLKDWVELEINLTKEALEKSGKG